MLRAELQGTRSGTKLSTTVQVSTDALVRAVAMDEMKERWNLGIF